MCAEKPTVSVEEPSPEQAPASTDPSTTQKAGVKEYTEEEIAKMRKMRAIKFINRKVCYMSKLSYLNDSFSFYSHT